MTGLKNQINNKIGRIGSSAEMYNMSFGQSVLDFRKQ